MKRSKVITKESFDPAQFLCPQLREDLSYWLEDREPEKDVSDESDESEEEESDQIEQDNVNAQGNTEKEVIKKFLDSGCGCKVYNGAQCSQNFSEEALSHMRADNLQLSKDECDLIILAHLRSSLNTTGEKRKAAGAKFWHKGTQICKKMFLMINAIGNSRYKDLVRHYKLNGLVPRRHENTRRLPSNALTFDEVVRFKTFMLNYAANRAITLPGKYPGNKDLDVLLLPSHDNRYSVWRFYVDANKNKNHPSMQYSTFCKKMERINTTYSHN